MIRSRYADILLILAWSAVLPAVADGPRPAPPFAGKGLPEPPEQGRPWTAPASRLPRFLVDATATLFGQGLADPRGCEYRSIELGCGSPWGGAGIVATHGWVLPAAGGEVPRFAVAWSGLVYPVVSVGEPADLGRDVLELEAAANAGRADVAPAARPPGGSADRRGFLGFGANGEGVAASRSTLLPIKVCLLLRLGRADLAETAWAAGTGLPRTPPGPAPKANLTTYGVSYLTLATDWAWYHFERAVGAHIRGDDAIALADARKLAAIRPAIEARAEELGFVRPRRREGNGGPSPYIDFLGQLPALLADHERRAVEPKRPPTPPPGGDKTARVAALILDLDRVAVRQWGQPGGVSLGESPVVKALMAEGDEAVGPLIEALRGDDRLTRSVHFWRDFDRHRTFLGAHEAAYAAIAGILQTSFFGAASTGDDLSARGKPGRDAVADRVQAYWDRFRAVPLVERWYRILADDRSDSPAWLGAAGNIVQPENVSIVPGSSAFVETVTTPIPPDRRPRLRGEALRQGHDPTVSALMARRFDRLLRSTAGFDEACAVAARLDAWDPPAALPALREAARICRERLLRDDNAHRGHSGQLGATLARFTVDRLRLGDAGASRDYAAWVRASSPGSLEHNLFNALEPLYRFPADPALAEAADGMFNDPRSAWVPLFAKDKPGIGYQVAELISSPLVGVPGFRRMLLRMLDDRTPAGTAHLARGGGLQVAMEAGWSGGRGHSELDPLAPEPEVKVPFRLADYYAFELSSLEGSPAFELYWPEGRRDAGLAAMKAHIERFGPRFLFDPKLNPRFEDFPHPRGHLVYPTLDRPASRDDVAKGLALFSLEGEGERRVVALADRPIKAKWVTLKDFPYIRQPVDPKVGPETEYYQSGRVWQAEEVFQEGRWRRYFGFVGGHVVARVPAEEIEFTEWPYGGWRRLTDGLDATFFGPYDPDGPGSPIGHQPGSPLVVTLRLRNRAGHDRPVPTSFVRREAGKVAAIRRGVEIEVDRAPPGTRPVPQGVRQAAAIPWAKVPARAVARFDPDDASRTLPPAGSLEAFSLDLADLFDLKERGLYRVRLAIAKGSGVAEGTFHPTTFVIGEVEAGGEIRGEVENQSF